MVLFFDNHGGCGEGGGGGGWSQIKYDLVSAGLTLARAASICVTEYSFTPKKAAMQKSNPIRTVSAIATTEVHENDDSPYT